MSVKLLIVAALVCWACRRFLGKWPWDMLRPPPTRQQEVLRARKLLGVRLDAGHAEIIDAHRKLITIVHPDRGGTTDQVHEANAARDVLLNELPNQS